MALTNSLQYIDSDSILTSYHILSTARSDMRLYMPQINHITLKLPAAPPLSQPTDVDPSLYCNSTAMKNCNDEFCYCTHMLNVKRGSLVEVILVDEGVYWGIQKFMLLHALFMDSVHICTLGEISSAMLHLMLWQMRIYDS